VPLIVLDTNVVVAALNQVGRVVERLAGTDSADVLIPDLVIAELLFGAYTSTRVVENVGRVERLVALFRTAPFDLQAARLFAQVKSDLRRRGQTKQDFDLAIASVALVHGATLVTHDGGLLDGAISQLNVEDWLAG
jgi:tRNA(fMet)-specific endonuclease VapC